MPESLFLKSCRPQASNFIDKETLAQVFFSEFCEISKNTFSTEHLQMTVLIVAKLSILDAFKGPGYASEVLTNLQMKISICTILINTINFR